MTLPAIITAIAMAIIMVISIAGGSGPIREELVSEWSWAILMVFVLVLEVILIVFFKHTLSNQMMWWITMGNAGVLKAVFWIFIAYHFILQPVVNAARKLNE